MAKTDTNGAAELAAIELLVLDVDGVLADGRIILDGQGRELKSFHVLDGAGVKYWLCAGKQAALISGRTSPATTARAAELGVTIVIQNAKDKLPAYESVLERLGLTDAQTAVMGDDLTDLPMMRRCGFAIAPANAVQEVCAAAALVTAARGGQGAVREAVEHILKHTGKWREIMARYRREDT